MYKWIKKILRESRSLLRDLYKCPYFFYTLIKLGKHREQVAILLGTPLFNNLGDHLIALSEIEILSDLYGHKNIIEIPTPIFLRAKKYIKNVIKKDDIVFITGGGWMGGLWPDDEYIMQDMIEMFSENRVIVFPQTIYYDLNNELHRNILNDANRIYSKCTNLVICVRDKKSYDLANKYFMVDSNNICLVPDIALYYSIPNILNKSTEKRVGICIRDDRESLFNECQREYILKALKTVGMKCIETDTVVNFSVPIWKRKKMVNEKINEFSTYEFIITDRLHGMIFSVLSGRKCIVIDNKTHKVKGVYELWLRDNENIFMIEKIEDITKVIKTIFKFETVEYRWDETFLERFEKILSNGKD